MYLYISIYSFIYSSLYLFIQLFLISGLLWVHHFLGISLCVNNIIYRLSNPTERNPKQQLQDPKRKKETQGWICLKPAYFYFLIFLIRRRPRVCRPPVHSGAPAALKTPTQQWQKNWKRKKSPLAHILCNKACRKHPSFPPWSQTTVYDHK